MEADCYVMRKEKIVLILYTPFSCSDIKLLKNLLEYQVIVSSVVFQLICHTDRNTFNCARYANFRNGTLIALKTSLLLYL